MSFSQQRKFRIAAWLISLTLLWVLRFALELALFPLPIEINPGIYDTLNLDERRFGWSQVALLVVVGIITWIPFRRGELWAWITLWLFLPLFAWPVVLYPLAFAGFHFLWRGTITFWPMLAGLLLVAPSLLRKYHSKTLPERG